MTSDTSSEPGDGYLDANEAKEFAQQNSRGVGRILKMFVGIILIIAGIAMLILPGQGVLTILFGLDMVAPDNPVSRWIRKVTPGLDEDTPIPIKWIVIGTVMTIVVIVASLYWGDDIIGWFRN